MNHFAVKGFVFQKVVSVKLEKTSGLDLNSAAAMEELLSQVHGGLTSYQQVVLQRQQNVDTLLM